jgi:broad specificity phosphatase PhoE
MERKLMKASNLTPPIVTQIPTMTTVYIVRHAEKASGGGSDPDISPAGQQRAETLARMLKQDKVKAVFVTATKRSRQTGTPAAVVSGVVPIEYDASDSQSIASLIKTDHSGQRVLVIAHTNTLKVIAAKLVGSPALPLTDIPDSQYDWLYVVHMAEQKGHLDRLRYGVATP